MFVDDEDAAGRGGDARSELGGGEARSAASWTWHVSAGGRPPGGSGNREPAFDPRLRSAPASALLAAWAAHASPAWLRLRPRHRHRRYDEGPGADRLLEPPRPPRRGLLGLQIWWLSLLRLVLFFSFNSLLKVEAWGREKKTQCRKGRYELTCQRRRRKTPVRGELSSPRRDRSPGFARSGAAAAVPQPGVPPRRGPRYRARPLPWRRAPRPVARDQGTPQLDFLCSFSKAPRKLVLLFHYL
nr:uncharacterized protein LOC110579801 [Neomonachus schauinslandi]